MSDCPVSRPWNFAIIAIAGFPGIIRGRKKFSVTAAQRVSRKNPARRSTNRICARHPLRVPGLYLGARCSSSWPTSGYEYAAGRAYGLPGVTQPVKLPVLYWYQVTCWVIGMNGTSFSTTCWSWFTIWCCVAESVVVAYWLSSASVAGLLYRSQLLDAFLPIGAEFAEYSHGRNS